MKAEQGKHAGGLNQESQSCEECRNLLCTDNQFTERSLEVKDYIDTGPPHI